ncbi:MAG: YajQ family cyclic di-GMP-binding protein [Opitutaceae bacterium]|nr:YajQ family cyclic di-GMP-binding protein [Cytophagales bacterium]
MPSFDIVNKVDLQQLDNAVNVTKKEIQNRFDFRDSKTEVELDKQGLKINLTTDNSMRIKTIEDILLQRAVKQNIDGKAFDFSKDDYASGAQIKKEIIIRQGIEKEEAKKIVKIIKELKIKVEASIMDDQVRVTAKKIDDLQAVMQELRKTNLGSPLQFVNMKS